MWNYSALADQLSRYTTLSLEENIHSSVGSGFSPANVFSNPAVAQEIAKIYDDRQTLSVSYRKVIPIARKLTADGSRVRIAGNLSAALYLELNSHQFYQYNLRFSDSVESDSAASTYVTIRPFTVKDKMNDFDFMIRNKNNRARKALGLSVEADQPLKKR